MGPNWDGLAPLFQATILRYHQMRASSKDSHRVQRLPHWYSRRGIVIPSMSGEGWLQGRSMGDE